MCAATTDFLPTKTHKFSSYSISIASRYKDQDFFLFGVKFEYLVTQSCIFCFVSPPGGFISHKICIIFQQRQCSEIKILLTSILSGNILHFDTRNASLLSFIASLEPNIIISDCLRVRLKLYNIFPWYCHKKYLHWCRTSWRVSTLLI